MSPVHLGLVDAVSGLVVRFWLLLLVLLGFCLGIHHHLHQFIWRLVVTKKTVNSSPMYVYTYVGRVA